MSDNLRESTVQEIQLELIRRTTYNAMDGEKVYASLLKHRDLWLAVMLDRQGLPDSTQEHRLSRWGLIKLRDLPDNFWNADTLFILTESHAKAQEMAAIIAEEGWEHDDLSVIDDRKEIGMAIGALPTECGLLSAWWD